MSARRALAVLAFILAWPAAVAPVLQRALREDWFRDNFEVVIIAGGTVIIAASDWLARAWIETAPQFRKARTDLADVFSMTFACAIGALAFVAIGSSAFSARLAQVDFASVAKAASVDVGIDRALSAAEEMEELDREIGDLRREMIAAGDEWCVLEREAKRLLLIDINAAGNQTPGSPAQLAALAAARRVTYMGLYHDNLVNDELDRLKERACVVRGLAQDFASMRGWREKPDDPRFPPPVAQTVCPHRDFGVSDYQHATSLIGVVQPLGRAWMSSQLARRTPIVLSIELVLVFGALGAMLRAASPYLLVFVGRLAGSSNIKLPEQRDYLMLTLALHAVFGMATALIFFVLLRSGINLTQMSASETSVVDTDLNPFTTAALGLIGGYASMNVVQWVGRIAEGIGSTRTATPETNVEQVVAVGLMLAIRDFLKRP